MTGRSGPRRRTWSVVARLRLRTVLALGVLVPLMGMGALAAHLVRERGSDRAAALHLQDETRDLSAAAAARAALAKEELHASLLALVADLGLAPGQLPGFDEEAEREAMYAARADVDRAGWLHEEPRLANDVAELQRVRQRLDTGSARYTEVAEMFGRIEAEVERTWSGLLARIEAAADLRPLPSAPRARLRAVREAVEMAASGGLRLRAALGLLLDPAGTTEAIELAEMAARFQGAADRLAPALGPRARPSWEAFWADPSAQRTEQLLGLAASFGAASPAGDPFDLGMVDLARVLRDGARWGTLLADLVMAATADLEAAAAEHAQARSEAVAVAVGFTVALGVVSLLLAGLIARQVVRPAFDLEQAARRLQRGELDLAPIPVRGPRELSGVVQAFNDMAGTLARVQDHAVALAEHPDDARSAEPLPGRTGRAMQGALDRLQRSIRQAEAHRQALHELATRDGMTGLLNRTAALEAVQRDLARARRAGSALAVIYVDLDNLKSLNDTYGHATGDEAIRRVAQTLVATTRESDVLARLGGDEFLVAGLVPPGEAGEKEAAALAERIASGVAGCTVRDHRAREVPLSASVGVATSEPAEAAEPVETGRSDQASLEALLRAADEALYVAKRAGGGQSSSMGA